MIWFAKNNVFLCEVEDMRKYLFSLIFLRLFLTGSVVLFREVWSYEELAGTASPAREEYALPYAMLSFG